MGFMTVQRIFIIDSLSIDTAIKASQMINPDAIEIMPGIMPKITRKMSDELEAIRGMKADTASQMQNIGYKELMKLVMSLPTGFRTVFNMYAIEGYSHKEIAEMLGITETTSRTQFSRARIWLQNKIEKL